MSFERFMELALYCPNYGYYEREGDNIGARGDFYTSVSVGGLFGAMLGWQFAEWLETGQRQPPRSKLQTTATPHAPIPGQLAGVYGLVQTRAERVRIVEAGAHNGQVARDILLWLRERRPALFARLDYCIVEPSDRRRGWQEKTLADFPRKVGWVSRLGELRARNAGAAREQGVHGIIFSNELLDAFPVRRWGWDAGAKRWFEWGVTVREDKFEWARMEAPVSCPKPQTSDLGSQPSDPNQVAPQPTTSGSAVGHLPLAILQDAGEALEAVLPDGFTVETNEAAAAWWREAAEVLECGRLVTLDYGLTEEELFTPERKEGTLRAYRKHQVSGDVLADPGEQDLTAHVNFTRICEAGEAAGLQTEVLTTQERFLTGIAARIWQQPESFGGWTDALTRQFRTLTHPEHLGRAFRVLVQERRDA